jgi:hypothetical protein
MNRELADSDPRKIRETPANPRIYREQMTGKAAEFRHFLGQALPW